MSKFWQKKYISEYTGAEIDAAVAQAGTVPTVTSADAGKILGVDSEGKIVAEVNKADIIPTPTIADREKGFIVGSDGKLHYAYIGNCVFENATLKPTNISEGDDLVTFANSFRFTSVTDLSTYLQLQYNCPTNTKKCFIHVEQTTAMGLLSNNTASFNVTKYHKPDILTTLDLDLKVGDYFDIGDEIYLNMSTDMCVVRCVDSSENSATFAGSFLTAANPLLANKLIYTSVLIQSDGTKWTVTMNIIKYALST